MVEFGERLGYAIERFAIVAICLWGNWAIYYWVAVLGFDASYAKIKAFIPILLLQVALSLTVLVRLRIVNTATGHRNDWRLKRQATAMDIRLFAFIVAITMGVAIAVVVGASHLNWFGSSQHYNLFWVALLPFSLAYIFYFRASEEHGMESSQADARRCGRHAFDSVLFLVCAGVMAIASHGAGFPTPDDAFYGHVMSSTIANPGLPIQGQDLLLGTDAPYSLHPAYRPVGLEILVLLLSDVTGVDRLYLYFKVMPVFSSIIYSAAAYLFLRAIRSPYPGAVVAVTTIILLLLSGEQGPGHPLKFPHWGKSQVLLSGAPLLFFSVANYVRSRNAASWLLLLLTVCTVAIWSSTALFLVPVSVGLASLVFVRSIRADFPVLLLTSLTLVPILALLFYIITVLNVAPVYSASTINTGILSVWNEAWGGHTAKGIFLVALLVLPLMSRAVPDVQFQNTVLRASLIAYFTVMAPYLLEAFAHLSGLNFLAVRLPRAFPVILLAGVGVGVLVGFIVSRERLNRSGEVACLAILFALTSLGLVYALKESIYSPRWMIARAVFEDYFAQGEEASKLLDGRSLVAAGSLHDQLPIFSGPSTFIWSRHYLHYHRYAMTDREFEERKFLYQALRDLKPAEGENMAMTLNSVVAISEKLGVDTLVFKTADKKAVSGDEKERAVFFEALTARLQDIGYSCVTTPSGKHQVCSK